MVACFGYADHLGRRSAGRVGLSLVVLGVETGCGDLRGKLGKSTSLENTAYLVEQLKSAGISVGLTLLTGYFGEDQFSSHLRGSVRFCQQLELERQDRIYISPWFGDGDRQPGQRALDEAALLKQALSDCTQSRLLAYSAYNFHYFS